MIIQDYIIIKFSHLSKNVTQFLVQSSHVRIEIILTTPSPNVSSFIYFQYAHTHTHTHTHQDYKILEVDKYLKVPLAHHVFFKKIFWGVDKFYLRTYTNILD